MRATHVKNMPIISEICSECPIEIKEMVFTAIESRILFTWENISAKDITEGQEGRK